jgi:hypothetical protein
LGTGIRLQFVQERKSTADGNNILYFQRYSPCVVIMIDVGWRFEKERKRLKGKLSSRDLSLSQQK